MSYPRAKDQTKGMRKQMGARRNDIGSHERAQIAVEVMASQRQWGTVTKLAEGYALSRQAIYDIAAVGRAVLLTGMEPKPHGPQAAKGRIEVGRERLVRGTVVLTEAGVSQRAVVTCLAELLDRDVSLGWVNGELAKAETAATRENAQMQPSVAEGLSGDEIYAKGEPNLLVVGNDSLYIYALSRQASCDGDTWGSVLLDAPDSPQFASDGGTGLAAGVKAAEIEVHQLDWDHLLRPLWGRIAQLEKQAYAALAAVEARATQFDQAQTAKRLENHLVKWEALCLEAEEKVAHHDDFLSIARQVDQQFALIDLPSGQWRDPDRGAQTLRALGKCLQAWHGRIYAKLGGYLTHFAEGLFAYLPVLTQALSPLMQRWGKPAIQALARIWQIEADERRHPLPVEERPARQSLWDESLDMAFTLLGPAQLWQAWDALCQVLDRSWRGSMLAECINSLLRPYLNRRKHTDQGFLELFRFLHNARPFKRGKRAGHSPAALAGLNLPSDPLILLGLAPKVSS
jgi:hypothetical protein